jgi:hypothetical protein
MTQKGQVWKKKVFDGFISQNNIKKGENTKKNPVLTTGWKLWLTESMDGERAVVGRGE